MKLLIFTSFNKLTLALFKDDELKEKIEIPLKQNLTEVFIFEIKKLFAMAKIKHTSLKSIYLPLGPGSFTNDRVVGVFAKTMEVLFPEIKLYAINRFIWFSDLDKLSLVALQANSQKSFVAGCEKGEIKILPELVSQIELKKYAEKFPNFFLTDENKNLNIENQFNSLRNKFALTSWKKLTPYSITDDK